MRVLRVELAGTLNMDSGIYSNPNAFGDINFRCALYAKRMYKFNSSVVFNWRQPVELHGIQRSLVVVLTFN
jgi:hypothetical protein